LAFVCFFFFVERELREGDEGINNIRRPKIGEERERERERERQRERGGSGEGNASETKRW
jgi:hypothetical protein